MTTGAETREERFERGMKVLTTIDGESGQKVIDSLAEISPELGHQIVSWAFGDIYARPALAPRDHNWSLWECSPPSADVSPN